MCRVNTSRMQARQIILSSLVTASLGSLAKSIRAAPAVVDLFTAAVPWPTFLGRRCVPAPRDPPGLPARFAAERVDGDARSLSGLRAGLRALCARPRLGAF